MSTALLMLAGMIARAETVRVGMFVGNNIGFGEDAELIYAEQEARDMARLFQQMGALSRDRTVLLAGAGVAEVREAVFQTEAQIREISARGDDVMLIFFYSGHASADGLHLSGNLLPMAVLRRWLESSAAEVRVAFVDACGSGALTRSRGGTPVDAVEIVVDDTLTMSGLAVITSTGPAEVAREADSFGGGVFTQALLSGLRGSADGNNDGQISLEEAYNYARTETITGTAAASSIQRPERRYDLEGVGAVVLTRIPSRAAGLLLPEELEGTYTVVSVSTGLVVARIEKVAGEQRRLALPTGRYLVRKVRREDVLLAEVDLAWGGDRWLQDAQMDSIALGDPLARGGWNLRPLRLSIHGTAAPPLMSGTPGHFGVEGEVRYLVRPGLGLIGVAGSGRGAMESWGSDLVTSASRLAGGVLIERHQPRLDLSVSAGLQAVWITQRLDYFDYDEGDVEGVEVFTTAAMAPGLWAGGAIHLPLGPVFGLQVGARGGILRAEVDYQPASITELQVFSGLSASLGGKQIARAGRHED
ncbi:MAG: hypothetical protein ACI8RZ_004105 [Myxococcota bacterium]|jgi:hypothetical protein